VNATMYDSHDVAAVIDHADFIANADNWRGDRHADVTRALLRAIAVGLAALTAAAEDNRA
jgi:hypothetical protein